MANDKTAELINRRRRQVLVHSCIYYRFNESLITDHTFDAWARELTELQRQWPEVAGGCVYAEAFKDFDGSTGFDLPLHDPWVMSKAAKLLEYRRRG